MGQRQGSGMRGSCVFSLLSLRGKDIQRNMSEEERPGCSREGHRARDPACYRGPFATHLVEEVNGGEDGKHGHGQSHILGGGVRGQDPSPSLPPSSPLRAPPHFLKVHGHGSRLQGGSLSLCWASEPERERPVGRTCEGVVWETRMAAMVTGEGHAG